MKSSDDDKHSVGPREPQIPTDSWKLVDYSDYSHCSKDIDRLYTKSIKTMFFVMLLYGSTTIFNLKSSLIQGSSLVILSET
ncbi:hypothetical protein ACI65C_010649 [Semiaphis heraclei]